MSKCVLRLALDPEFLSDDFEGRDVRVVNGYNSEVKEMAITMSGWRGPDRAERERERVGRLSHANCEPACVF